MYEGYEDLSSTFKKTTISVELTSEGTLRKINAQATDKTRKILKNFAQGAVQIAKMAAGAPPLPMPGAKPLKPWWQCTPEAAAALAAAQRMQRNVDALATKVAHCINKCDGLEKELAKSKTELEKKRAPLSQRQTFTFVPEMSTLQATGGIARGFAGRAAPYAGSWMEALTPDDVSIGKWFVAIDGAKRASAGDVGLVTDVRAGRPDGPTRRWRRDRAGDRRGTAARVRGANRTCHDTGSEGSSVDVAEPRLPSAGSW